jgi:hypothetical protein
MHTLIKITMSDVEAANASIKDGRFKNIVDHLSKKFSPEFTGFYAENGFRSAIFIVKMQSSSMIPSIAEPFFLNLNARVEFFPMMDMLELSEGLELSNQQDDQFQSLS